jgi:hypothetical protein
MNCHGILGYIGSFLLFLTGDSNSLILATRVNGALDLSDGLQRVL